MKRFPIAERFTSLQGEGLYTGTLMHFIRFAGCSVGKKISNLERASFGCANPNFSFGLQENGIPVIPSYREKCTTYDGREFLCDTDFRTKEVLTKDEIVDGIPKGVAHICLTGGEPLNQPIEFFLRSLKEEHYKVHIETSGTISFTDVYPDYEVEDSLRDEKGVQEGWLWITVSPKKGLLDEMIGIANEIKLLVDADFDVAKIPVDILDHRLVWIQPINQEFDVDRKNLERCIQLLHEHPTWRMSTQLHKIWKVR